MTLARSTYFWRAALPHAGAVRLSLTGSSLEILRLCPQLEAQPLTYLACRKGKAFPHGAAAESHDYLIMILFSPAAVTRAIISACG